MLSVNVEQRVNVQLCVKLGKCATEMHGLLKRVYGDECLYRGLSGLRREGKRSEKIGAPLVRAQKKQALTSKKSVKLFDEIGDWAFWHLIGLINIDKETVRMILCRKFKMKKVSSKMVPRILTPEQKEIRMSICADIHQNTENNPNFLQNLITCDESCFFNTTQKVSANPCTGRAPVQHDKRKHGRANPNLKQR